jgi:hypothetical protein
MAARNEVLAVEVERDRAELESLRAGAAAEAAEANLQRLLALPPATRVEPAEALEAPAAARPETEVAGPRPRPRAPSARPSRARGRRGRRRRAGARGAPAAGRALTGGYTSRTPTGTSCPRPPTGRTRGTWGWA